ncbi:MAG: LysR family transcriptional regulator, partial [Pseudomonadota bacterium]
MDWEDIKTFAAIAETGSIRRAGKALSVHHSTVSRRIERLETSLATRLFDRRPEGFELTEAGEELLSVAGRFTAELSDTGRRINGRDEQLSGKVRLTMAEPLAVHGFAPRLAEFADRYPDLQLEINVTFDFLDLARGAADVAIRMDNNPPDILVGKRLFPYSDALYASPDYFERHDIRDAPKEARWIGWSAEGRGRPAWVEETPLGAIPVW